MSKQARAELNRIEDLEDVFEKRAKVTLEEALGRGAKRGDSFIIYSGKQYFIQAA